MLMTKHVKICMITSQHSPTTNTVAVETPSHTEVSQENRLSLSEVFKSISLFSQISRLFTKLLVFLQDFPFSDQTLRGAGKRVLCTLRLLRKECWNLLGYSFPVKTILETSI